MRAAFLTAGLLLFTACRTPLDPEWVAALGQTPEATLCLTADGHAAVTAYGVPEEQVPPRARQAARAVQPDGTRAGFARERGPAGLGYRLTTWYGTELRTVLVSDAGAVLDKSWTVAAAAVPAPVLATATNAAPGERARVEVLQGTPGEALRYRVTQIGPDHRTRWWIGDASGQGTVWVLSTVTAAAATR